MAWMELVLVIAMVGAAMWLGRRIGGGRGWGGGFLAGLAVTALLVVGRRMVWLSFVPPVSWMVLPTIGPVVMAAAIPVMLGVLAARLGERRKRVMIGTLMWAMVAYFAVVPVAAPLVVRGSLLSAATEVDRDGVCLQKHSYSCGPAAAVTCLGRLGIHAEEGRIAAAAWAAPSLGTE